MCTYFVLNKYYYIIILYGGSHASDILHVLMGVSVAKLIIYNIVLLFICHNKRSSSFSSPPLVSIARERLGSTHHDIEECNSPASARGAAICTIRFCFGIARVLDRSFWYADRLVAQLNGCASSTSQTYAPRCADDEIIAVSCHVRKK